MAKRFGFHPSIILTAAPTPTPTTVIGSGSAQSGVVLPPVGPLSYSAWLASEYAEDLIENGTIDQNDYAAWWEGEDFTQAQWEELNPDMPYEDYFD